jgi:hypothetical protein
MKLLMSPGRRFTSMAEWPCFEAFGGPSVKGEGLSGDRFGLVVKVAGV